jgi:site-specific recombinase XerD
MTEITNLQNEELLDRFEAHLAASSLASATVVNYLADLRMFARWLSDRDDSGDHLLTVDLRDVRAYVEHLKQVQNYASSTINRHLQSVRKFYWYIVRQGIMSTNPAKKLRLLPAGQQSRPLLLIPEEIELLLDAASRSGGAYAIRDVAILRLMVDAGLKVGELIDLTLDDLEPVGSTAYVYPSRTASPRRRVPLPPAASEALEHYLADRPTEGDSKHLFLSTDGSPISVRVVQRMVASHARTAGLDGVTPQTLRYAYAHRLMSQTGDLALVMERLGHRNTAITARYLRPRPRRHRALATEGQASPRE